MSLSSVSPRSRSAAPIPGDPRPGPVEPLPAGSPPWSAPLTSAGSGGVRSLRDHLAAHGPLPALDTGRLIGLLAESGLTGRGGAGFPTWRKLRAAAGTARPPVVVANGAEGEPASSKDAWLLATAPHLVLDGLHLVSTAVGATAAHLYVGRPEQAARLRPVADERARANADRLPVMVGVAAPGFLSGEASAVARGLSGGPAVPRSKPPRVAERGVRGRPTLVQNVETLAHIALIARHGAAWFRALGSPEEPGTLLVTVGGAVRHPGVLEVPGGARLRWVLERAGGLTEPAQALLVGGYHGGWVAAADAAAAPLSRPALAALGSGLGAGVIVALPAARCGLAETARVVEYLAASSAGQCGPCLNGLPRLAELLSALAGRGRQPAAVAELERITGLVDGRGACHHPDGTVRFVRSALQVFRAEVDRHVAGRCGAPGRPAVLPVPVDPAGQRSLA